MNIDLVLVVGYLLLTLAVGVWKGRNIKNITEYAVADRNYSTGVLVATIFATWVGGESTMGMAEKVYSIGIVYIIIFLGSSINKFILATIIAPRITLFSECISVGDIIGKCYGRIPRIITGLSASIVAIVTVAAQISSMGYILHEFLEVPYLFGIILSLTVLITYSAFGGIKAVASTDVLQFITLAVAIPVLCSISLVKAGGIQNIFHSAPPNLLSFTSSKESIYHHIFLFIVFSMPFLNPAITQRLLMAKNVKNIVSALKISALIEIPFVLAIGAIGLSAVIINPELDPNVVFPYLINNILPVGIKGLVIVGMIAIIMSTADSFLNSASIGFTFDFIGQITPLEKNQLLIPKIATVIFGLLAAMVALKFDSIFGIIVNSFNYWTPIVVVPLYAGLFGVRAKPILFIASAFLGALVNSAWIYFDLSRTLGFDGLIPSAGVSLATLLTIHSLSKNTSAHPPSKLA